MRSLVEPGAVANESRFAGCSAEIGPACLDEQRQKIPRYAATIATFGFQNSYSGVAVVGALREKFFRMLDAHSASAMSIHNVPNPNQPLEPPA